VGRSTLPLSLKTASLPLGEQFFSVKDFHCDVLTTGQKSMGSIKHKIEPPKMQVKISISHLGVYYLTCFVIVMRS
jgi:hypothetical protein